MAEISHKFDVSEIAHRYHEQKKPPLVQRFCLTSETSNLKTNALFKNFGPQICPKLAYSGQYITQIWCIQDMTRVPWRKNNSNPLGPNLWPPEWNKAKNSFFMKSNHNLGLKQPEFHKMLMYLRHCPKVAGKQNIYP